MLCYVIPLNSIPISSINLNLISSLDLLTVQPVSSLVRRFGMSATCLESHQINVIQKKYYQNSLLHVSRQDTIKKPTGATRRKRKKRKNEQQLNSEEMKNEKDDENEEKGNDLGNEDDNNFNEVTGSDNIEELNNESNHQIKDNEGTTTTTTKNNVIKEKKVSKRAVHWIALSDEINENNSKQEVDIKMNKKRKKQEEEDDDVDEEDDKVKEHEKEEKEIQKENNSFFGWLLSYFRS